MQMVNFVILCKMLFAKLTKLRPSKGECHICCKTRSFKGYLTHTLKYVNTYLSNISANFRNNMLTYIKTYGP